MTKNQFEHSDETQALAALYALGSLAGEERVLFEEHLARNLRAFTKKPSRNPVAYCFS